MRSIIPPFSTESLRNFSTSISSVAVISWTTSEVSLLQPEMLKSSEQSWRQKWRKKIIIIIML